MLQSAVLSVTQLVGRLCIDHGERGWRHEHVEEVGKLWPCQSCYFSLGLSSAGRNKKVKRRKSRRAVMCACLSKKFRLHSMQSGIASCHQLENNKVREEEGERYIKKVHVHVRVQEQAPLFLSQSITHSKGVLPCAVASNLLALTYCCYDGVSSITFSLIYVAFIPLCVHGITSEKRNTRWNGLDHTITEGR